VISPDCDTARPRSERKPSAVAKPSEADERVSRVSPDCDSAARPCAKEAKRSDHAERSRKRARVDE
jgi:hypothetical protein